MIPGAFGSETTKISAADEVLRTHKEQRPIAKQAYSALFWLGGGVLNCCWIVSAGFRASGK